MEAENFKILNLKNESEEIKMFQIIKEKQIYNNFNEQKQLSISELKSIENLIFINEFAIIENWNFAFETKDERNVEKEKFSKLCFDQFKLMETLPIPEKPLRKIKFIIKLASYAYLGEKWEDIQRYLTKNESKIIFNLDEEEKWDKKLFYTIFHSFFYLIKKNTWEDLSKSIDMIVELRKNQHEFERNYLDNKPENQKFQSAHELASLYHLAKSTELISLYLTHGKPPNIIETLEFHKKNSLIHSEKGQLQDLNYLQRLIHLTYKKMIFNSIWYTANRINSRFSKYANILTNPESSKPIYEFMYPQRIALLEQGLLNPVSKAIVVNLPTSSGKTLIAKFRILQALNQFAEEKGWIAYIVPTRTLVNQVTNDLRRDLSIEPLSIKVEKMSGALEIDSFEDNLINQRNFFDILVTTPEKFSLLVRQDIEKNLQRNLVLTIIDEAHNIGDETRGLNLELLLSVIMRDCPKNRFLLLTPFIPNNHQIAEWLDPQNPRSIKIQMDWQPNQSIIGLYSIEGSKRNVSSYFEPKITSDKKIKIKSKIKLSEETHSKYPFSKYKNTKYILSSYIAQKVIEKKKNNENIIITVKTKDSTWKLAEELYQVLPKKKKNSANTSLVMNYISDEISEKFPLIKLLEKGIGIHHAGLPDEIRYLMEWLMKNNDLSILISTTTIVAGINFPVSSIIMASYSYPYKTMPASDFMNLTGRVGRIYQSIIGTVGIIVTNDKEKIKASKFIHESIKAIISILVKMVNEFIALGENKELQDFTYLPEWSTFAQYISHMYNQADSLSNFLSNLEITLNSTYGYRQLEEEKKEVLLEAVEKYVMKLDKNKGIAKLSDLTGFCPETIKKTLKSVKDKNLKEIDWTSSHIFSSESGVLADMVGIMIDKIPEISQDLNSIKADEFRQGSYIASIINDWVGGKKIDEISNLHFSGIDINSITKCISVIYSKIINLSTWGLSSIQKLTYNDKDRQLMSIDEQRKLSNLPAMIYYGVNTDEGILMRINNVPRTIANRIGKIYCKSNKKIYDVNSYEVVNWLSDLESSKWIDPKKKSKMKGEDYKNLWKILNGKK
ncbi:hypothetical protein NEF87_002760 [Candidatus Lokiarchaeum ossiferum]|uniref:DEAD/DEAH box helicase n=1 Tax=Candidatus Lokiarchaeum ossiferum TaxID=2951803 RepID=A0ABY6HSS8_9ARCH|nr:hypothetical protein NEF87_002760 [Candidatus Lokiarchaeum sp. B-35]